MNTEDVLDELFDTEYMTGKQPNLTKENVRQALTKAREEERYACMDLIEECRSEHNVARHGEDYEGAYDRAIDCINPALT